MKGGNFHRGRGKHFFTLLSVVCMTFFLWSYERKPLVTTLLSSQDQFILPSSDVLPVATHVSEDFVRSEDRQSQESSHISEDLVKSEDHRDQELPHISEDLVKSEDHRDQELPHISEDLVKSEAHHEQEPPHISEVIKPEYHHDQEPPHVHEETDDKIKSHMSGGDNTESVTEQSSVVEEDDKDAKFSSENKVCNYAKGRWVVDRKRPLYSGFKCKQWLSEMWACRLTQRTDFGYEAYRWQPSSCDMPEFERTAFLKRMQDKTIAFVGDSLGRQQFQSLMCMVTGGEEHPDVQDVGRQYGLVAHHGAARPDGWAFRFPKTNTTILYYWSSCLCDLEPLNPSDHASEVAMHLDRPPSFLKRFLHRFDVVILNTGHHWNRGKVRANRWVMYVDGKPNQDKRLFPIGNAKNFTIFSVARWLDSQLPSHPHLKAFFRTLSPRHFFNGEWNTGGSCENTTPLARGSEVKQEESSDQVIASAIRGTKVTLLDITALSQLRDEGHISRYSIKASSGIQDCLHWCLPGIPDTWNEILAAQI